LPYGNPAQDVGCEFFLTFFSLPTVYLYNASGGYVGGITATMGTDNFTFSVPLSSLNDDDGAMNLASNVGTSSAPTDWVPDAGHGEISPLEWLRVAPTSGTVADGDSVLMVATFDATEPDVYESPGTYPGRIEITSPASPVTDSLNIPVRMTVIPPPGPRLVVEERDVDMDTVIVNSPRTIYVRVKNI